MTLLSALRKCLKMWRWLENNPDKEKHHYFQLNGIDERPSNDCYFCEYTITDHATAGYVTCNKCPGNKLWRALDGCSSSKSPYSKWRDSPLFSPIWGEPTRRSYAKIIADFCDKEIKQLVKRKCKRKCKRT